MVQQAASYKRIVNGKRFSLIKKPARSNWYIVWHDERERRIRRRSTGTEVLEGDQGAKAILEDFVLDLFKPHRAPPEEVPLAMVLSTYLTEKLGGNVSTHLILIAIRCWLDYWGDASVASLRYRTAKREDQSLNGFIDFLLARRKANGELISKAYACRILSVGRAALHYARQTQMTDWVPYIPYLETKREKFEKPPRAASLDIDEIVRLIQAIQYEHHYKFVVISLCTLGRPSAIIDLQADQADFASNVLHFNRPGRPQSRKYRGIRPMTPTLKRFMEHADGHLINYFGRPVTRVIVGFRNIAKAAGLPPTVKPSSMRYSMGRLLRQASVPSEQISVMLDHQPVNMKDSDHPYSPIDPAFCIDAVTVIEKVCRQIEYRLGYELSPENAPTIERPRGSDGLYLKAPDFRGNGGRGRD